MLSAFPHFVRGSSIRPQAGSIPVDEEVRFVQKDLFLVEPE